MFLVLLAWGTFMATMWFFVGRSYERLHQRYSARVRELDALLAELEDDA